MPVSICIKCKSYGGNCYCNHPETPYTDFIFGTKDCRKLNPKGACQHFVEKKESDSPDVPKPKGPIEASLCICCHEREVIWPKVCDGCIDHEDQALLAKRYGNSMDCKTCGMIHDGGECCNYCGDKDPLSEFITLSRRLHTDH